MLVGSSVVVLSAQLVEEDICSWLFHGIKLSATGVIKHSNAFDDWDHARFSPEGLYTLCYLHCNKNLAGVAI